VLATGCSTWEGSVHDRVWRARDLPRVVRPARGRPGQPRRKLSPRAPSPAKIKPYESGVSEPASIEHRWPVRFALVAMLFLIFDVEALFFYPWAVILRELRWYGIIAVAGFFIVLGVGYLYARARGALRWR